MIQINLLPDIKRQYLHSQRVKQTFMLGAFVASGVSVGVVVLIWLFTVSQNVHLGNLQDDIDEGLTELQSVDDLDKVVTVQNQLSIISDLYDQKPEAKLLFDYLTILTPGKVSLGSVDTDFVEPYTVEITGASSSFKEINQLVDTIKNATFVSKDSQDPTPAFSNVVLQASGGSQAEADELGFGITANFDPAIFDNNLEGLILKVPSIISSQSETQRPKSLFDPDAQLQQTDEEQQ